MIEFHKVEKEEPPKIESVSLDKESEKTQENFTMESLLKEASAAVKNKHSKTEEDDMKMQWLFHISAVPIKNIPERYGPKTIMDLFREQGAGTTMESWDFLNLGIYPYNFEDIIDVIQNGGVFVQEDKEEKESEHKGYPRLIFVREAPETGLIMRVTLSPTRERVYVFTKIQETNFKLDLMHRIVLRDKDKGGD